MAELTLKEVNDNNIKLLTVKEFFYYHVGYTTLKDIHAAIKANEIDYIKRGILLFVCLTDFTLSHQFPVKELKDAEKIIKFRRKSSIPKNIEINIQSYLFSRSECIANPKTMFIFPDNAERSASRVGNTEKIDTNSWYYKEFKSKTPKCIHVGRKGLKNPCRIRGCKNAYPITTRLHIDKDGRFTNPIAKQAIELINQDLERILSNLDKYDRISIMNIKFGKEFGNNAIAIVQNVLDRTLQKLGIDNTMDKPRIIIDSKIGRRKIIVSNKQK